MDDLHSRAEELLIPKAKQAQQRISKVVHSILASDPKCSPEEVQRAATFQVGAFWRNHPVWYQFGDTLRILEAELLYYSTIILLLE